MSPKTKNHIFSAVCGLIAIYDALPQGGLEIVPPKWKSYIEGVVMILMAIKSHQNLFIDPVDANKPK